MPLTDTRIRNAKAQERPVKIPDGGGLHLIITPNGSKLWRLAYRFAGKQKTLAIGTYPDVSLGKAREARSEAKRALAEGVDLSVAKKAEHRQRQMAAKNTFQAIAEEWVEKARREGRAAKTLSKAEWLLSLAYPIIGRDPITEISSAEVLEVLRRVEKRGRHETARRLRGTIGGRSRLSGCSTRPMARSMPPVSRCAPCPARAWRS